MRIAHVADLHLGFRSGDQEAIREARERDVALAFTRCIDGIVAASPDAVMIAGDLFHTYRPTNQAMLTAHRELSRLRDALPEAPIVLIAGNHDMPKSVDVGCVLPVFQRYGIEVVLGARRLHYPRLGLSILAVGDEGLRINRPAFTPDGDAPYQVLLLHGDVPAVTHTWGGEIEYGGATLAPEEFAGGWSAIMLGDYHIQREVAPRAWYAGAPEYACTNPWPEIATPKGWLLWDLEADTVASMAIERPRRFLDLPPLSGYGATVEALNEQIAAALADIEGACVRLTITELTREQERQLDWKLLRERQAKALMLRRRFERPEVRAVGARVVVGGPVEDDEAVAPEEITRNEDGSESWVLPELAQAEYWDGRGPAPVGNDEAPYPDCDGPMPVIALEKLRAYRAMLGEVVA